MLNRMKIEELATTIMKRAVVAEYIPDCSPAAERNTSFIHFDFIELADRLGYRVEKKEQQK